MTRMRILSEAYKMLLLDDPGTSITMNGLRMIVKSGHIPTVQIGRKTLVNYDALLEFFFETKPEPRTTDEKIRAIH